MFCDELQIKVIAGKGGDGCVSLRREKYVDKGGPDGGDGGRGGSIHFKVNENLNTLSHLTSQKTYRAENGEPGHGKKMSGKSGQDLILEVPQGTVIYTKDKSETLADLSDLDEEIIIVRGGKGGLGNTHFKSSTRQTPRIAELGEPGEDKEILLELRMVADVGIMGLPSAGKSTLISVISNARPKIADYPFTTLVPNLGVVSMSKFGGDANESFVVCDIPGLIEGASQGKGLGHQFLRHVSRTKILVHLIDVYLEKPDQNYTVIREELKEFDKNLAKKPELIVLNKIDLVDEKQLAKQIKSLQKVTKKAKIFSISAATHRNLKPLLFAILEHLEKIRKKTPVKTKKSDMIPVLRPHLEKIKYHFDGKTTEGDHRVFHLSGGRMDQLVIMTDFSNPEGLERIYHYLDRLGINRALQRKGIEIGDIIRIKGKDISYRP
ncbi:MAG: GTPase ObgE [Candidatus Gracilibacteria bacterium]